MKSKKQTPRQVASAPSEEKHASLISRTVEKISSTVRRALGRTSEEPAVSAQPQKKTAARPKRTDVAIHADTRPRRIVKSDELDDEAATIPSQQSFRETFDERHTRRNEENTLAAADYSPSRFNDEDRFTNRSKDPRIGTRGRRYHP